MEKVLSMGISGVFLQDLARKDRMKRKGSERDNLLGYSQWEEGQGKWEKSLQPGLIVTTRNTTRGDRGLG